MRLTPAHRHLLEMATRRIVCSCDPCALRFENVIEGKFKLVPTEHQRPGRPHGWAKIHSAGEAHGVINLEWHGRTGVLICRVVTKFGNKPNSIIGDFIDYLLARHQSRILAIHIMRR